MDDNPVASEYSEEELNDQYKRASRCGLMCFPKWLQKLASKKAFLVVYGLMGLNHQAFGAYFNGTISTLEKRFKLPSTSIGLITSAWDIGQITGSLFVAYYGNSGNRTKWVGYFAFLPAMACFLRYFPHYYFGPGADFVIGNTTSDLNAFNEDPLCLGLPPEENCSVQNEGFIALSVFTMAHLISGLGVAAYDTLGASFLDDNVPKNKFALLYGIVSTLRFVGPAVGYAVVSLTLSQYIDANLEPSFGREDPRWIGAWHLGWIPFGSLAFLVAFTMLLFPRWLPREAFRRQKANLPVKWEKNSQSFKAFKETMKRLLNNKIIVLNTFSSTFYLFALNGYWIFMPKYIETQFRQPASTANIVTGGVGLVFTAAGILSSGVVISKFKPSPVCLAAWNVFTESVDIIGRLSFAFIGCRKDNIHGSYNTDGSWNLTDACNAGCNCSINLEYSPVCSAHGVTFYSPCHAGCHSSAILSGVKTFLNCSCLPEASYATDGSCPTDCGLQFIIFIVLLSIMNFLSASGRAGNTILQYRSVAPEDKSVSIAFSEIVWCAFTFIPAPIFYGKIIDSSCLIWGSACGELGNCWFYSDEKMRYLLSFTCTGFLLVGTLLDVGVMLNVGSLQIYDEADQVNRAHQRETEMTKFNIPLVKRPDLEG